MNTTNLKGLSIGWRLASLSKNLDNQRVCPVCGKKFVRRGKRNKSFVTLCCSIPCAAVKRRGKLVPIEKRQQKHGQVRLCKTCNQPFQHAPSRVAKYCSLKCRAADKASFDAIRGRHHYNWRGGITPQNVLLRRSVEARAWTLAVFRRDGFRCRACGHNGKLEAHHIHPWSDFPSLRFELSNGITLCKTHHRGLHWYFRHLRRTIKQRIIEFEQDYL